MFRFLEDTDAEIRARGPKRLLSMLSSDERKKYPVTTGFVDYFPDAIAACAHLSWLGNQKHNPGQELHWSRGKSADHDNCQGRHLIERGSLDNERIEHMVQKAWRAMAELQEYLEKKYNLDLPRGARSAGPQVPTKEDRAAAARKL